MFNQVDVERLKSSLREAQSRNKDSFQIIGAVSGLGLKKVREIANGKVYPTYLEYTALDTLSRG